MESMPEYNAIEEAKLKELDEVASDFESFLKKVEYLENLQESDIFKAYNHALLHDTDKYFPEDLSD